MSIVVLQYNDYCPPGMFFSKQFFSVVVIVFLYRIAKLPWFQLSSLGFVAATKSAVQDGVL